MTTKVIFEGKSDKIILGDYSKFAETFYNELIAQNFNSTKINIEHDVKNNKLIYTFEAEGSFPNLSSNKLVLMNPFLDTPSSTLIKIIREETK
jgi:hypothetical protein